MYICLLYRIIRIIHCMVYCTIVKHSIVYYTVLITEAKIIRKIFLAFIYFQTFEFTFLQASPSFSVEYSPKAFVSLLE